MIEKSCDLVIIGSGPGGYVAAVRARQLGLSTIVVERDKAGGVCGNWGCIPSKALIHQASMYRELAHIEKMGVTIDRSGFSYEKVHALSRKAATKSSKGVEYLLKKNNVEFVSGNAKLISPRKVSVSAQAEEIYIEAKSILLATGSTPKEIPGFEFDEDRVLSSTGLLSLKELPKSLAILGGGAIGLEFAYVMNAFGTEVTVIEMMDRVLPLEDPEISKVVFDSLSKQGIKILTGMTASHLKKSAKGITMSLSSNNAKSDDLQAEKLLVAVGRTPQSQNLGLEELGIKTGCIEVGDYYQSAVPGIYAIGDLIDTPLLAHLASKEAELAVEHIAGLEPECTKVDPQEIPSAVYIEPGVGSFGLTEEQAKQAGRDFGTYVFPYNGIGKASAIEKVTGLVKIIFDTTNHEILGAHIVGHSATEIIHELLLAKKAELLPEDIANMIHAHPTISEGIMESARGVEGWAIHI